MLNVVRVSEKRLPIRVIHHVALWYLYLQSVGVWVRGVHDAAGEGQGGQEGQ